MTKSPPVPQENRSPKGTGDDKSPADDITRRDRREPNPRQQGEQGNIKQNTTNQGYQQNR
jgi:hypothetical protein